MVLGLIVGNVKLIQNICDQTVRSHVGYVMILHVVTIIIIVMIGTINLTFEFDGLRINC